MNNNYDKNKTARHSHLKVILTLRKLLLLNKEIQMGKTNSVLEPPATYRNIYYNSDIREATISDTFNGKTLPTITTLLVIIDRMGYTLKEFTDIYDKITEEEVLKIDEEIDEREYFR